MVKWSWPLEFLLSCHAKFRFFRIFDEYILSSTDPGVFSVLFGLGFDLCPVSKDAKLNVQTSQGGFTDEAPI